MPQERAAKRLPREASRPGRTLHGVYVTELAELKKVITLCWACRQKFDHEKYHYFYERNIPFVANCDACRRLDPQAHFYIHESFIGVSWTPRRRR